MTHLIQIVIQTVIQKRYLKLMFHTVTDLKGSFDRKCKFLKPFEYIMIITNAPWLLACSNPDQRRILCNFSLSMVLNVSKSRGVKSMHHLRVGECLVAWCPECMEMHSERHAFRGIFEKKTR